MAKYRYPGAQPFHTEQSQIFFGREEDTRELFQFIQLEKLIVLFGKSGLGKSSLLNAGIIPLVRKDQLFTPIPIRFGAYTEDKEEMPLAITKNSLRRERDPYLRKLLPDDDSLWTHFKSEQSAGSASEGFILIFDQFEELFTYPDRAVLAFKREFSELVNTTIPQRYLEAIQQQMEGGAPVLSETELAQLHEPFKIKAVVAIRSDRIHLLNELADYLPDIRNRWYELGALQRDEAEEAILNPAFQPGADFISSPFDYEDEAIEAILKFLTKKGAQDIESFQLQILCQSVEQKVISQGLSTVQALDIGDPEQLYENYYDDQISRLETEAEQLSARRLIEEGMIFEEEERRLSLYEGQIHKSFGVAPDLLAKLVNSHLVRAEPSLRGGYTYELSHDTLVGPVLRAKEKRLAEERRRTELAEREEERRLLNQERKKRRRASLLAIAASILALIAIVASIWAVNQSRLATQKEKEAINALDRFLAEKTARERIELNQLIQDAATYADAYEYELAIEKLEKALAIDSTNQEVLRQMNAYRQQNN